MMNGFQLAGDLVHLLAIFILLWKICKSRSCVGISGKSQILFCVVYFTRYLDLFFVFLSTYNSVMKIVFIGTSAVTIYFMYVKFKDSNDTSQDSFPVEILLIPCFLLALVINYDFVYMEVLWTFSIYLDTVALLPQFFLMGKTGKVETHVNYYLLALGSYRVLYLLNWAYRYVMENHYDLIGICAGVVQTMLYFGFFCFYMTKLSRSNNLANNLTISPLPPIRIIENLKEKEASQMNV